jgi:hypothetical protein
LRVVSDALLFPLRVWRLLHSTAGTVDTSTSGTGAMDVIDTVAANEEVHDIGKTVLDGVPALISTLEDVSEVHPFVKGMLEHMHPWGTSVLTVYNPRRLPSLQTAL